MNAPLTPDGVCQTSRVFPFAPPKVFDDPQLAASIAHIIVPANEQNLNRLHASLAAASD